MSDICTPPLNSIWNTELITQESFPNNFKLVDAIPSFKKDDASLLETKDQ